MSDRIRVLTADDHALVREGLHSLLGSEPGVELDLVMPRMGGLEAIRTIREVDPEARLLVLTSFAEDDQIFPAIKAGALGYLLKDTSPRELLQAVREVDQGDSFLDPVIARKVIQELKRPPELLPSPDPLTVHELEVL